MYVGLFTTDSLKRSIGSIIMTGTPKGVGFVKKPPTYLKHGDQVSISIGGGIGTIVNSIIEEGNDYAKL